MRFVSSSGACAGVMINGSPTKGCVGRRSPTRGPALHSTCLGTYESVGLTGSAYTTKLPEM